MPNLATASKKALQENKIQQLDTLGQSVGDFIEVETTNIIENALGDFISRVKKNIEDQKDMITTGKISDISIEVENGKVNVYAYDYLSYQDKGVNGSETKLYNTPFEYKDKMPPVDSFKEWIKRKNINLLYNEKYYGSPSSFAKLTDEEKIEKAAWGMAMGVFKKGIKPKNLYTKEIPRLIDDLTREIADFTAASITFVI
jgi:hypothetical protein